MPQVRISLVGGHTFDMQLTEDATAHVDELVTAAWALPDPVGHLLIHPPAETQVTLKLSLRDVVGLEIARPT